MSRIAIVHKEKCNPTGCGDYLCYKLCPVNRTGSECITKSEKVNIDEELCTGCGICANRCPFDAISIIKLPEELKQEPIHQYGPNGFRLYSLPTPIFGKVVGVLGVNGIGKSTAIKILSGVSRPNFGDYTSTGENNYDKLIDYFKGTEAQKFFESVKAGNINISYKPQQVDMIPKQHKGKIRDLLVKVDEKDMLEEISQKLELTKILDHNIEDVSGGELQRVAIAATVLRKANFYVFDELTSYLDIKQRLKISKFIRSLADENTAVMVIEHDLIALDYMTDLVHIMYGKKSCYGIVSLPKSAKNGINTYLEGYLKEENVRFRDKEIKFDIRPPVKKASKEVLVSWDNFDVKLGSFSLHANEGKIDHHEIVGVLGENGIGKTTFVRNVAEKFGEELEVSFKPQYIEGSDELVQDALKRAIQKYKTQLISPLNLESLFTRKLSQLSGGELQTVLIVKALSQKNDIVLLDEPSAYLDVEQRLLISKVIRNFAEQKGVSALVVDHDLLFIDYLTESLLVFDGVPSIKGNTIGPISMEDRMNSLLKEVDITLRRDKLSKRPRINKLDSRKDREQKSSKKYYYS